MGAKMCTAVLALPHPNPIPHKSKVGRPACMIGHVNTIDHDKQQGSTFKSLSLNLMHGVYE